MKALQHDWPIPDAASPRTVYIVDDEMGIRLSVTRLLDDLGFSSWAFGSGKDFLEAAGSLAPGCLLLDVQMAGMDGIEVIRRLGNQAASWPIIIMTAHADVPMAVEAMKQGALEFVEKPFSSDLLEQAVTRGFAKLASILGDRALRCAAARRLEPLSPREHDVLRCLLAGKQNKVIAFELGLSVRTVEMHRGNLLHKVGVQTLQEVVAIIAQANGFGQLACNLPA